MITMTTFTLLSCLRVGCILPQLITAGTVTRRGVESTWLTASNPKVLVLVCYAGLNYTVTLGE